DARSPHWRALVRRARRGKPYCAPRAAAWRRKQALRRPQVASAPSRPLHFRRQRRQDRLDIAAGLEAKQRAAIVEQIELHVAAAAHQLFLALGGGPRRVHVAADEPRVDVEKRPADVLDEGEVVGPAAGIEIVEEDAADAARLAAVRQMKVLVAPGAKAFIVDLRVRRTRGLHGGMKV